MSRWLVCGCVLPWLGLLFAGAVVRSGERPNVLFLFSDDQRWDTIAALGNDEIKTPNLDALVRRGTAFTHAYCMGAMQGAVCVPSRAMLMTGRSLFRVPTNLLDVPLWPRAMTAAGYATFGTGKWHNGQQSFARAFDQGRSVFFGGMHNHLKTPVSDMPEPGKFEKLSPDGRFSSEVFAGAAIEFLASRKGKAQPFFCYVAFTAPHDPRMPPDEYRRMYDPAKIKLPENFLPQHPFNNGAMTLRDEALAPWPRTPEVIRRHIAEYYGMISHLDAQIGRIFAALDESGQADNTIVVFAGDHGLSVGRHGLLGKQNLYEHGMRTPLIFAGPGIPENKQVDAFAYLFDICPTVCALTGVEPPEGVDGKNLVPVIDDKKQQVRESVFTAYTNTQRAVRNRQWKLIRYPQVDRTQLFHIGEDPHELHDLSGDEKYADKVQEMTALLKKWQRDLGDKQSLTVANPKPAAIDLSGRGN